MRRRTPGRQADNVALFASLKIRNYRLFFVGGFVSNIGTWMARIAQDWLVLTILTDNSSTALGLTTALQFLPVAALAGLAGVAADRFDKRRLLQVTQASMLVTGLALAVLVLTGVVALWHVYLLSFLAGVGAAFDGPARQAFAPEIVPRRLIPNAVGLNTTSFNAARLIGPAVAGLMIAWWGVGPALVINALSFAPVIWALALQNPAELHPSPRVKVDRPVRDGLAYVRRNPRTMLLLFTVFMLGTFGMNFQITNALMATEVFKVGSEEFGFLGAVMAVGSLAAGLMAAKRSHPRMRTIMAAMTGFGVCVAGLTFAPNIWFYAVCLVPTGFFALTVMTVANASVQLATPPAMRGRVMALYMAIFLGGTPIGSPLLGWVGDALGARWTLAVGFIAAFLTVAAVVICVWRSKDFDWPRRPRDPEFDYIRHGESGQARN
ncbi:MAG: MFS transporter [Bifidobacteriaceae bacterium]|nr:MFS transporter [Bifidobacteriaceae bacterium]